MRVKIDRKFHRETTAVKGVERLVIPTSFPPVLGTVPDVFDKGLAQGLGAVKSVDFCAPLRPVARHESLPGWVPPLAIRVIIVWIWL